MNSEAGDRTIQVWIQRAIEIMRIIGLLLLGLALCGGGLILLLLEVLTAFGGLAMSAPMVLIAFGSISAGLGVMWIAVR